jgi:hypothetical protein
MPNFSRRHKGSPTAKPIVPYPLLPAADPGNATEDHGRASACNGIAVASLAVTRGRGMWKGFRAEKLPGFAEIRSFAQAVAG